MIDPPNSPDPTRTPLYPSFILLFHYLKLNGEWIVYAQALMGALTASMAVKTAQLINRNNLANVFVGILVAINLPSIFMGNMVATEIPFTLLLTISIYYAVKGIRFREEQAIHFSVLFMAIATLCRPISLYFLFLIPVLYFLTSGFGVFTKIKTLILHLVIISILIGPWVYRNQQVFGKAFYTNVSEINLLFHTTGQIRSIAENKPQKSFELSYRENELGHLDFVNDPAANAYFIDFARKESKRVISENPAVFVKMWTTSMVMFFIKPMRAYFNMQLKGVTSYQSIASVESRSEGSLLNKTINNSDTTTLILVLIQLIQLGFIYFGIILSLKYWFKNNLIIFGLLGLLVLYMMAVSGLTEVDGRFRIPIIPILAILSVPAFESFFKRKEKTGHE